MHEAVSNQVSSLLPVPEVDWAHIESITAEAMHDDIDKLELTDQELHDPVCLTTTGTCVACCSALTFAL